MQRSLFLLFLLTSFASYSQISTRIFQDGKLADEKVFRDTLEITNYVRKAHQKAVSDGYLFSGLDSVSQNNSGISVYLHKGKKSEIEVDGIKNKSIPKGINKRIQSLTNSGYPFASIKLDSVRLTKETVTARMIESKGPLILNDSAFFFNPIKTNHHYLYQLIDHVPGKPFSELEYHQVVIKMGRSPFLRLRRPVDLSFQKERATLYLDIVEEESNRFQGVLGLQQAEAQSSVIGSIDLSINNMFRSGKEFELHWERFDEESQELQLRYKHPFFLDAKLAPMFEFNLLKQDTSFLTRSTSLGLGTYLSASIELSLNYTRNVGTLLTDEEEFISQSNFADYTSDIYRMRLSQGYAAKLEQYTDGVWWGLGLGVGTKQIDQNLSIPDSFYDTLKLQTDIFSFDWQFAIQKKLFKRQAFYQFFEAGIIDNGELLSNERYRLGGLNSLRGFNEKFFFADRFFMSKSEFRSFFERGSYLYVFYDQLIYTDRGFSESPYGAGLGFSLATSSGQFRFAFAIGKSADQDLDLRNLKAHFGYTTRF